MNDTKAPTFGKLKSFFVRIKETNPAFYYFVLLLRHRKHYSFNRSWIRGQQNRVVKRKAIFNGTRLDIVGEQNCIEIDQWAVLDRVTFHIRGNRNKVSIGSECRIANSIIWVEDNGCKIKIGSNTTIGGIHLAATEDNSKIIIGGDCMLAYDIDIRSGDSHGIYDQCGNRINKAEDIIIGQHVWIATRATILKGSDIGSGSIVGTGAVVTHGAYPADCILAGNPAKVIREDILWSRSRQD